MSVIDTHSGVFFVTTGAIDDYLEPTAFDVGLDIDRSPHVIAHLTIPRPAPAVLARFDPRTHPVLNYRLIQSFEATETIPATLADASDHYAGGTLADATALIDQPGTLADFTAPITGTEILTQWNDDPQPIFTQISGALYITDHEHNYREGTLTLTLQSGEFRLDDHKNIATAPTALGARTINWLLTNMVTRVGGTVSRWAGDTETLSADLTRWLPGVSIAELITPILEARGLRLYADSYMDYRLAPIGEHSGLGVTGARTFDYTEGMIDATSGLSITAGDVRAGWYDAAIVVYDWTDTAEVAHTAYDIYPAGGANTRGLTVRRNAPYPGPGAARGIVRRSLKRGHTLALTAATDYAVGPGWDATVRLPDGSTYTGWKIISTDFQFPQGEMTVRLQSPLVD